MKTTDCPTGEDFYVGMRCLSNLTDVERADEAARKAQEARTELAQLLPEKSWMITKGVRWVLNPLRILSLQAEAERQQQLHLRINESLDRRDRESDLDAAEIGIVHPSKLEEQLPQQRRKMEIWLRNMATNDPILFTSVKRIVIGCGRHYSVESQFLLPGLTWTVDSERPAEKALLQLAYTFQAERFAEETHQLRRKVLGGNYRIGYSTEPPDDLSVNAQLAVREALKLDWNIEKARQQLQSGFLD